MSREQQRSVTPLRSLTWAACAWAVWVMGCSQPASQHHEPPDDAGTCVGLTCNPHETTDAGEPPVDAGAPQVDAGAPEVDAGVPPVPTQLLIYGGDVPVNVPDGAVVYRYDLANRVFSLVETQGQRVFDSGKGMPLVPALFGHVTVWDWKENQLLSFGGMETVTGRATEFPTDLRSLRFSEMPPRWKETALEGEGPVGRMDTCSAWDSARRRLYVFGGTDTKSVLSDFWVLDAARMKWTRLHGSNASGAPSPRFKHT